MQTPCFESGIVKLQRGMEHLLSRSEAETLKCFLLSDEDISPNEENATGGGGGGAETVLSPTRRLILEEERLQKKAKLPRVQSKYMSTVHAKPTSNVYERMFSQLKLILTDRRHRLEPSTIEIILFLKINWMIWDIRTIASILGSFLFTEVEESKEQDPFHFLQY